jgi:hypothetical protein
MPIVDFYARSESDVVTFDKTQISFSASLVDNLQLLEYDYARIGIDPELRRIYFAFQKEAEPGLLKFYRQAGKSKRKMLAAGKLYADYDWIAAIKDHENKAKKQFILEAVDPADSNYPKYKYYVTVGYAWAPDRDFRDMSQFPAEPGVYRLKKSGEVVRIGEGNNIAARLNQHLKEYAEQVDSYDFEIVPNDEERKIEQKRLLESFRASVGKLPKLNSIAN